MPEFSHRVWSISLILLKVEIPNSVCECILGCKVLCTIFRVKVTLISGLSPSISPQISCLDTFSVVDCSVLFWSHYDLDLDLWLLSIKIMCGAYLLYYMTKKSHIRDIFWGIGMLHTVLGRCDLDLWPQYLKFVSPTLFEVTISNFVCRCILMLRW